MLIFVMSLLDFTAAARAMESQGEPGRAKESEGELGRAGESRGEPTRAGESPGEPGRARGGLGEPRIRFQKRTIRFQKNNVQGGGINSTRYIETNESSKNSIFSMFLLGFSAAANNSKSKCNVFA